MTIHAHAITCLVVSGERRSLNSVFDAQEKDIWGPFLIVAPVSTLHNWKDEINRFLPDFKVLGYWGTQKERQLIRRYWNPKKLYSKNADFHVLITRFVRTMP